MSGTLVRALALALILPRAASAQILGARVTAAGGIDAVLRDGSKYLPTYVGQLGLEWRRPNSRGALRLGLMHYQQTQTDNEQNLGGCSAECTWRRQFALTGLTFDGTFDLTRGRVRPYLLSGIGLYTAYQANRANFTCSNSGTVSTCTYTPGQSVEYSRFTNTFGMHSGVGLSASLGKASFFTELRVLTIGADGTNRGSRWMIPVTLGVKF